MKTVSIGDVPHLHSGVSIAGDKYIGVQLHARGERLVACECMLQLARLYIPHPDRSVEGTTDYMHTVKLKLRQ